MKSTKYLIGKATISHPENGFPAELTVVYFPKSLESVSTDPDAPSILVEIWQDGSSDGATRSPRQMLEYRPYVPHQETIDGVLKTVRFDSTRLGWFERKCAEANCLWFLLYVRRMADGELMPLKEIQEAYRIHNNGKEMPSGTMGTPFF